MRSSPLADLMCFFFFFNDTATTEIYTLSLHDALPISSSAASSSRIWHLIRGSVIVRYMTAQPDQMPDPDRKSTRLNSNHGYISYAVFCLKKKKKHYRPTTDLVRHLNIYTARLYLAVSA